MYKVSGNLNSTYGPPITEQDSKRNNGPVKAFRHLPHTSPERVFVMHLSIREKAAMSRTRIGRTRTFHLLPGVYVTEAGLHLGFD